MYSVGERRMQAHQRLGVGLGLNRKPLLILPVCKPDGHLRGFLLGSKCFHHSTSIPSLFAPMLFNLLTANPHPDLVR